MIENRLLHFDRRAAPFLDGGGEVELGMIAAERPEVAVSAGAVGDLASWLALRKLEAFFSDLDDPHGRFEFWRENAFRSMVASLKKKRQPRRTPKIKTAEALLELHDPASPDAR